MNNKRFLLLTLILVLFQLLFVPTTFSKEPIKSTNSNNTYNEYKLRKQVLTFIPYNELGKFLERNSKMVFMSYKELTNLINEKSQLIQPAPINFVSKDLSLNGTVNKDVVSFDAEYKIQILNKEWVYVPLLSSQVGLKSAIMDNKAAPISTDGSNFQILTDKVGEHTLKLKFDVKINETGNSKSFNFNIPNLPVVRLSVKIPEPSVKLNISNASGIRTIPNKNNTTIYATIMKQGNISVDWKSSQNQQTITKIPQIKFIEDNRPSKVIVDTQTLISVDEGILQGFSTYQCQIYFKPIEKLTLSIPNDIEIIAVTSPNNIVKKIPPYITNHNGKRILNVLFNSKIKDTATFNITYEKTFENKVSTINIPNISMIGKEINKVTGYIAIQSLGNLEVKQANSSNVTPVDIKDLPYQLENSAQQPILLAYSFIKDFYSLDLQIIPHKDASVQVAMIDKMIVDSRLSPNGIITTKVDYTVRNMSEQYFKFCLPKNSEILTGLINNITQQVEKETIDSSGNLAYLINIKNNQDEKPFTVSIMYKQDFKFNILSQFIGLYKLEPPKVLNIPSLTLGWYVYLPEKMKYWFLTKLNQHYEDYASFISYNSSSDIERGTLGGTSINEEKSIPAQVTNTSTTNYIAENDKAIGVLPPEFEMPPTSGLKSFSFSDYLLTTGSPNIYVVSITKIALTFIFFAMLYIGWLISNKVSNLLSPSISNKKRAITIIPIAVLLYISGLVLGNILIWLPMILSVIAYTLYNLYKIKENKLNQ